MHPNNLLLISSMSIKCGQGRAGQGRAGQGNVSEMDIVCWLTINGGPHSLVDKRADS